MVVVSVVVEELVVSEELVLSDVSDVVEEGSDDFVFVFVVLVMVDWVNQIVKLEFIILVLLIEVIEV